eukprot:5496750-Pyramimonas_sp.AAC.1
MCGPSSSRADVSGVGVGPRCPGQDFRPSSMARPGRRCRAGPRRARARLSVQLRFMNCSRISG